MKRNILSIVCIYWILTIQTAICQPIFNEKNVDRTAMSFFDGLQTFRAMEYTDSQGNNKVYRLQTLPENGFPAINLQGVSMGNFINFEDKAPYDNQFTDNPTSYLSTEAVQLHYGFQSVMKVFDQRFGWKGLDGIGALPVDIYMENADETPLEPANTAYYHAINGKEYFTFNRSLTDNIPFISVVDVIAHEFTHAVVHHKSGTTIYYDNLCHEFRTIGEGISDIFGIYIKNKIKGSTPQNYNWIYRDQISDKAEHFATPKTYQFADTYNGEYYVNVCTEDYNPHPGAGVAQKWFYLLAMGFQGSAYNDLGYGYSNLQAIGVEKAIQIVWDAIPLLTINTNYPTFRTATLKAAEQLYGLNSAEYIATQNAWCAVGVCDNNLVTFSLSPANGATNAQPWPAVNVSFSWQGPIVQEWEVETSTNYNFSNPQTVKVTNFTTVINPNGGAQYTGTALCYFHPGERVYARARITQAPPNFCKGLNPLCQLYQVFSPTHSFTLNDKQAETWSWVPGTKLVNPWKDPTITWKSVNGAQKYTFRIAKDKAFSNVIYTGTTSHTGNFTESGVINAALDLDTKYYFQVRAERLNSPTIVNNFGAWSKTDSVLTKVPPTLVGQAKNQKAGDPASVVSSMGFWVNWDAVPGAADFVVQVATDDAFTNVVRQQTVAGNLTTVEVLLPYLPNLSNLFVRILPLKVTQYGTCANVWRIKTDENAIKPVMFSPVDDSPIGYKDYLGATFEWKAGSLNMNLVDHFELHLEEKTSGITTIYNSPGKVFDFHVKDQLMFDDKNGIKARVRAVGPLGAKSALSLPFTYPICPDHPGVTSPGDLGKIDPSKAFTIFWNHSLWINPGDSYQVTIKEGQNPVPGFNNTPTLANSMTIPAGTLGNNKTFTLTVKNPGSCPGIFLPQTIFSTTPAGNNNPPAAVLKNFTVELHAFRNDASLNPPATATSDYFFGVQLLNPNGVKVPVVDGNGIPVTQLLVDSENAILVMAASMQPVGKYTLKLTMLNIVNPALYFPFDQPRFSVLLDGKTIINNHIITIDPINPASPFHEWQVNFKFSDIILDVK